jgi:oligopeptide/dipeptide ABC transporter ATP-binding protein
MSNTVLDVRHLKTSFFLEEGELKAVDDVSFRIEEKQTLGLIGESGCGKSVSAQSVLRIVPPPGRCVSGEIFIRNSGGEQTDIMKLSQNGEDIRKIRGREVAMIFQEPMSSLSPVYTIGDQIVEALSLHMEGDKNTYREKARELIDQVGIPDPSQRIDAYPHQLSGGLRQRAMIAMALSCNPSLLIADEPTTALDVTVQAQILDLLRRLQDEYGMAVLFITHDLGVIAEIAEMTAVMYLGKIVEYAKTREIYKNPLHPYTAGLLKATLSVKDSARERLSTIPGMVPMAIDRPAECGFRSRCASFDEGRCIEAMPELVEIEDMHFVRCFLHHQQTEVPSE